MKIIPCFIKTFRENIRDWKILILVLVFAPFFIYVMHFYMDNPDTSGYDIAVLNKDRNGSFSASLINEWENIKTEEGNPVLKIHMITDTAVARREIRNKETDLFITIPENFTETLRNYIENGKGLLPPVINYGDQTNVRFIIAASFIDYSLYSFISRETGIEVPVNLTYDYAGSVKRLNEFDLYVPALLVFSVIMMLFSAGASIVREIEKDTITRLSLSRLTSAEFMTAISLNQIIIGVFCILLTLLSAFSVGYTTTGSIPLLFLVGILTCFSVIAISIITVSFIRTMFGLLTLGCFPFFLLMFFSDCFLPLPKINLFRLFGNQVFLNDILPTATATRALNKILNYDSLFSGISFELIWIFVISIVYFIIGILLFRRKYKY